MLQKVSEVLAKVRAPGRFVTRRTIPPGDLRLEVKGAGAVGLPVSQATVRKLCAVARPARYGLKEQTLLDPKVRDTWEIAKSRVRIDRRRWNKTLLPQLQRIRRDLGLPEGCRLKAHLHNMLVYEPGQFFAAHQDSEKTDDMVGALVVVLPSAVKGGALVVEHSGETVTCRGSDKALTFIAFYADCRHEVRPVKEGYRVVLTYNLILAGEASPDARPLTNGQTDALARVVREYFETPVPRNWRRAEEAPPDRLVYLLDHEYTQRGLGWNRLKNEDAVRVAALREVAERLDCGILLALAEVHEMWSCEEEDYGRYGWYGRYDDEDEEEEEDDPVPIDLEDFEIELHHCVGPDQGLAQIVADIDGDEVCSTKDSDDFEPYESEYEGYMGNYGNTLDRWYHRAAVVLWPRERTFVLRARASAHWAMGEVAKQIRAGDVEGARRMAEGLLPFWQRGVYAETRRGFPALTLKVAAGLEAPDLAAALLEPFGLEQLTAKAAPHLVALAEAYGIDWCASVFEQWESRGGELMWLVSLPELCRALCADGSAEGRTLAGLLVESQCAWVREEWQDACGLAHPGQALEVLKEMSEPMLGLIESSRIAGRSDLPEELLGFLTSESTGSPVESLVHLLRSAHQSRSGEALRALHLTGLHRYCAGELRKRLDAPARRKDDWSIAARLQCACQMCQVLSRFLTAPDQVRYEWPLAKAGRAHVHQTIDGHDLPVDHTTRRSGRPYTLVLTKTKALFQREAAERKARECDVRWLKKTAHAFRNG